jgi:hypothetical protein
VSCCWALLRDAPRWKVMFNSVCCVTVACYQQGGGGGASGPMLMQTSVVDARPAPASSASGAGFGSPPQQRHARQVQVQAPPPSAPTAADNAAAPLSSELSPLADRRIIRRVQELRQKQDAVCVGLGRGAVRCPVVGRCVPVARGRRRAAAELSCRHAATEQSPVRVVYRDMVCSDMVSVALNRLLPLLLHHRLSRRWRQGLRDCRLQRRDQWWFLEQVRDEPDRSRSTMRVTFPAPGFRLETTSVTRAEILVTTGSTALLGTVDVATAASAIRTP